MPDEPQGDAVESAIEAFQQATAESEEAAREAAAAVIGRARALAAVVAACGGNQSEAGRRLGLDQTTVNKLIKRIPAGQ